MNFLKRASFVEFEAPNYPSDDFKLTLKGGMTIKRPESSSHWSITLLFARP